MPLLQQTHYQYTQLSLSSRNMTPRNVVTAEGISEDALNDLREQVDQSMLSPDYSVVTNFSIQWDQIGAENRLIDLSRENEVIENELFAGLGVTREILTGEGLYSGNKISVEILNTKYLIIRERLQNFVEEYLFKPVALQNGFYEDDEDGNRTWFYPTLGFTRLTIRDNQEVFDQLFQLYQKGSVPIGMILDIFNINSEDVDEELRKDLFTVRDATFNEMLRQVYNSLGDKIAENTDLAKQIAESLLGPEGKKLKYTGEDADEEESGDEGGGDDAGGGDEGSPGGLGIDEGGMEEEEQPAGEGENMEEEESSEPGEGEKPEEDTGKVEEYISQFRGEGSPGDAAGYVERFRNEANARKYLEGIRENENARKYIERQVRHDNGNGDENEAREYLDRVLNEDENVKRYLGNFLGDIDGGDDYSDESQSAGL